MRIEICENTSIAVSIGLVCALIAIVSLGSCQIVEVTQRRAIEAGLIQKAETGTTTTVWTKP